MVEFLDLTLVGYNGESKVCCVFQCLTTQEGTWNSSAKIQQALLATIKSSEIGPISNLFTISFQTWDGLSHLLRYLIERATKTHMEYCGITICIVDLVVEVLLLHDLICKGTAEWIETKHKRKTPNRILLEEICQLPQELILEISRYYF